MTLSRYLIGGERSLASNSLKPLLTKKFLVNSSTRPVSTKFVFKYSTSFTEIPSKMDDYLMDEIDQNQSNENRIESRGNFYGNMMHPQKLSFADMFAPVSSGNVFEPLIRVGSKVDGPEPKCTVLGQMERSFV